MMFRTFSKSDVLVTLRPGAEWIVHGEDLEWIDSDQTEPSAEEIDVDPHWGARSPLDWIVPPGWTKQEWDNHWVIKWKNCVFENTVKK
jgi:hypothetical protein